MSKYRLVWHAYLLEKQNNSADNDQIQSFQNVIDFDASVVVDAVTTTMRNQLLEALIKYFSNKEKENVVAMDS